MDEHREPAAICYSACVVDGIAEMDTVVLPEHRGKRFLRIVSEPYFNQTIDKNLVAHWDTFIENSPSYVIGPEIRLDADSGIRLVIRLLTIDRMKWKKKGRIFVASGEFGWMKSHTQVPTASCSTIACACSFPRDRTTA